MHIDLQGMTDGGMPAMLLHFREEYHTAMDWMKQGCACFSNCAGLVLFLFDRGIS